MKRFRFAGGLFIAAAAAFALAGMQDVSLRHTPKAGEAFKYKMSGELSVMGQTVTMTALMTNKTTKVEANGDYSVEGSMAEAKIVINGSEMELPEQPANTTTFKADGTVIEIKGEGAEAGARMANLSSFIVGDKPMKAGDAWTSEVKGDAKKGSVDVSHSYKFEAIEKLDSGDAAKVTFDIKEKSGDAPAQITGTAWIDVKTGNAVKIDNVWKDVPVPGAPGPVNGKMTMTLVQ